MQASLACKPGLAKVVRAAVLRCMGSWTSLNNSKPTGVLRRSLDEVRLASNAMPGVQAADPCRGNGYFECSFWFESCALEPGPFGCINVLVFFLQTIGDMHRKVGTASQARSFDAKPARKRSQGWKSCCSTLGIVKGTGAHSTIASCSLHANPASKCASVLQ